MQKEKKIVICILQQKYYNLIFNLSHYRIGTYNYYYY